MDLARRPAGKRLPAKATFDGLLLRRPGRLVGAGMLPAALLLSVVSFLLVACRDGEVDSCATRPLRMATAASLREIGTALVDDFARASPPLRIEASFGASSALAYQIKLGAPIDVLISADERIVEDLARADSIVDASTREVARGRIVLAAAVDSELAPLGLDALWSKRLDRLGVPHAAVPLGRYASDWLDSLALGDALDGRIVRTEDARANLAALEQGHVDAAILYETDFRRARNLTSLHRPDAAQYPAIRYLATRTRRAPDCPGIDRLLDAWGAPQTRKRLLEAGFDPPVAMRPDRATAVGLRSGETS